MSQAQAFSTVAGHFETKYVVAFTNLFNLDFNVRHFLHRVHSYTCVGACAAVAATTFFAQILEEPCPYEGTRVLFPKNGLI